MLYGRDVERARIGALLEDARAARGGGLVLRGEPGVGKSALLEDARDRAAGMRVLAARGVESESELPFAGLHRLLRPALGRLEALPGPQADALRGALGIAATGATERFLVYAGVLTLLADLAEDEPVLCLLDDTHWLDDATADALRFVARRLEAEAVALLFVVREDAGPDFEAADLPVLRVGGLDPQDARELLAHTARVAPAGHVADWLLGHARGNALALLEYPTGLSASQLAGDEPLPDVLPLTDDLERVFLERVRRLPEPAQRLLLIAAADDAERVGTLTSALQRSGIPLEALADVERAGLLRVEGRRAAFRHPLVRSAVLEAATAIDRAEAHRVLAEVTVDDPDRRAWHLAAAALEPDAEAVAALEAAAERAMQRTGFPAAAKALERAAELSAELGPRGRRLVAAARAASLAGQVDHGAALAERAEPLVDDPLLRAEVVRVRAAAELRRGRAGEAHRLLLAEATTVGNVIKALELLAQAAEGARDTGATEPMIEIASIAASLPDLARDESCIALAMRAFAASLSGDGVRGRGLSDRAVAAADASDDPRELILVATNASWHGRPDVAARLLDRAATLARASGAMGALAQALAMRAPLLLLTQRFDDALVAAAETEALAGELGYEHLLPFPLTVRAVIEANRGKGDAARLLAERARELGLRHGTPAPAAAASWALAQVAMAEGRWADALERLQAIATPEPGVSTAFVAIMTAPDLVECAARAGRPEAGRMALENFEAWGRASGEPWTVPLIALGHAQLDEGPAAGERLAEAAAAAGDARPFDAARIALVVGEHLRRGRRRVDAREHLRAAITGFDRLGAKPWAERARAELRASGETARRRDASTLAELTPQELQVGGLVAEGLSNKEVAGQLFLSPRTIEAHLRNVFAKLDVTSRTQLARHPQFGGTTDASTVPAVQAAGHGQR